MGKGSIEQKRIIIKDYLGPLIIAIIGFCFLSSLSNGYKENASSYQHAMTEISQGNKTIVISRKDMGTENYHKIYATAIQNNYHITQVDERQAVLEK